MLDWMIWGTLRADMARPDEAHRRSRGIPWLVFTMSKSEMASGIAF